MVLKQDSDLCRQLVFANVLVIHVIMAIALFQVLTEPVRVLTWIGWGLIAFVFVSDALIDLKAKCKYCGSPLKKSKGTWNPQWELYKAVCTRTLICPKCGRKL